MYCRFTVSLFVPHRQLGNASRNCGRMQPAASVAKYYYDSAMVKKKNVPL